jgi:hypothetical protein
MKHTQEQGENMSSGIDQGGVVHNADPTNFARTGDILLTEYLLGYLFSFSKQLSKVAGYVLQCTPENG